MTATESEPDPGRGVYAISVAAELVGMGSQTLRLYEQRGLLEPARSAGGTRRYSGDDLERLRRIAQLVDAGLNLTGVAMVLDLQDRNALLQAELDATGGTPAQRSGSKVAVKWRRAGGSSTMR
ncbi:MAG TPA: MerR family transcriptional regulator [Dermatophilaceae bacterium]|jgi:DNA-binding transcriptional MerR regulator|nr:MerR family transcriptional regulator [Dermatophilaceae bacterium]